MDTATIEPVVVQYYHFTAIKNIQFVDFVCARLIFYKNIQ